MAKTILITGATDGIGLETARLLAAEGHELLLHGRNEAKLQGVAGELGDSSPRARVHQLIADLSVLADVDTLARTVVERHGTIDVLINNAGVFATRSPRTVDGLDARFAVNTIAPYVLARSLLHRMSDEARIVNLSSAAQAPVDLDALRGQGQLPDGAAYAQSKLALTMWSMHWARHVMSPGRTIVAVNPGSMLGTNMVREAYGVAGADIRIGAEILRRFAVESEFAEANGRYFDNDTGRFANPHGDALDAAKCEAVVRCIESVRPSTES